jgi:DNA-binding response OmpR family regulator
LTRILVADDSETILLLMRTRLEMEGYEVITAVDGQEVIEELHRRGEEGRPDVILLDAMMPRKSGPEVVRELRARNIQTPILIVSAHEEEAADRASSTKASGYIRKPIDFELLLGRIAELAAGSDGSATG